mmetsp:Transcript_11601/g.30637  ORF Transcript_11601/g.30637 Transcript_11601/m.30637 type:complete len:220 (-) Transcript_11601:437-1096(-)
MSHASRCPFSASSTTSAVKDTDAHANGYLATGRSLGSASIVRAASVRRATKNSRCRIASTPPPRKSVAGSAPWNPMSPHRFDALPSPIGGAGGAPGRSAAKSAARRAGASGVDSEENGACFEAVTRREATKPRTRAMWASAARRLGAAAGGRDLAATISGAAAAAREIASASAAAAMAMGSSAAAAAATAGIADAAPASGREFLPGATRPSSAGAAAVF